MQQRRPMGGGDYEVAFLRIPIKNVRVALKRIVILHIIDLRNSRSNHLLQVADRDGPPRGGGRVHACERFEA